MGIKGLWDAVAAAGVSARVELLHGKKVAIDASFWIGHCLASELAVRRGSDIYGVFFLRICYLLEKRVFPIFVFDGRTPGAKRRTLLLRNMSRARRTRNLKLLAFKALAVQMKHLAKSGNKRLFKPASFMKRRSAIPMHELRKISADLDDLETAKVSDPGPMLALEDVESRNSTHEEPLFSSDGELEENTSLDAVCDSDMPTSSTGCNINILTMPRSYRSLKTMLQSGATVDITSNTEDREIDSSYFDSNLAFRSRGKGTNRPKRRIELPLDCTINPECYQRLPADVRYQIMQQIKDAWMYDDRVNLQRLESSLSAFSNLQVESYLRDVEINREVEKIKRSIVHDTLANGIVKIESTMNLEVLPGDSFEGAIHDYNSLECRPRRKRGFLNDLSLNMQPELGEKSVFKMVKSEPVMLDDSLFLGDSELFGDLVKSESDDEFEVIDQRPPAKSLNDFVVFEEAALVKLERPDDIYGKLDTESVKVPIDKSPLDEVFTYCEEKASSEVPAKRRHEADLYETIDSQDDPCGFESLPEADIGTIEEDDSPGILSPNLYKAEAPLSASPDDSQDSCSSTSALHDDLDTADADVEPAYRLLDTCTDASVSRSPVPADNGSEDAAAESSKYSATSYPTSASGAIVAAVEDGAGDSERRTDESTYMYTNEWEYRNFLRMEKLFSHVDRSQYRMDEWDKVPELLDLFGVPFLVAPSEAEAQCAHLNNLGLCFGVISDDSDTLAFGARRVFKNFYKGGVFEVYVADRIVRELGLAREQIALLAIICGCDYTPGVRGIGVVNALEVIKAFPTFDELYEFRRWATSDCDIATVTEDSCPIKRAYKESHVNYRLHWSFGSDFPNREAYNLLLSPVVSSTFEPRWKAPRYDELLSFMEKHSSLPLSEVSTCLSKLRCQDPFDGYILEDFVPEIHSHSSRKGRHSLKCNRKLLQDRMRSFREFLSARERRKSRKAGASKPVPRSSAESHNRVAYIRSKRMLESIEGLKKRVQGDRVVRH
ncbi:DNA repair protein UVH3 [Babesia sp. Xinjiang]|uniref:DNA repair protein UVH3 n=1 Tax=Babesia sp. Xinjiang TaxID=462227 RepID=UPI000A26292C|nr:DNA repair protein UVH3 [Babesia sp. Xinjiang]ORM41524.1 DNA repair protein UVH3 [Babesia sp. Xinjiang]